LPPPQKARLASKEKRIMTVEAATTTPDSTAKREEGAPVNDNPQVVNLMIGARKG
jgi:hypothetical protein